MKDIDLDRLNSYRAIDVAGDWKHGNDYVKTYKRKKTPPEESSSGVSLCLFSFRHFRQRLQRDLIPLANLCRAHFDLVRDRDK